MPIGSPNRKQSPTTSHSPEPPVAQKGTAAFNNRNVAEASAEDKEKFPQPSRTSQLLPFVLPKKEMRDVKVAKQSTNTSHLPYGASNMPPFATSNVPLSRPSASNSQPQAARAFVRPENFQHSLTLESSGAFVFRPSHASDLLSSPTPESATPLSQNAPVHGTLENVNQMIAQLMDNTELISDKMLKLTIELRNDYLTLLEHREDESQGSISDLSEAPKHVISKLEERVFEQYGSRITYFSNMLEELTSQLNKHKNLEGVNSGLIDEIDQTLRQIEQIKQRLTTAKQNLVDMQQIFMAYFPTNRVKKQSTEISRSYSATSNVPLSPSDTSSSPIPEFDESLNPIYGRGNRSDASSSPIPEFDESLNPIYERGNRSDASSSPALEDATPLSQDAPIYDALDDVKQVIAQLIDDAGQISTEILKYAIELNKDYLTLLQHEEAESHNQTGCLSDVPKHVIGKLKERLFEQHSSCIAYFDYVLEELTSQLNEHKKFEGVNRGLIDEMNVALRQIEKMKQKLSMAKQYLAEAQQVYKASFFTNVKIDKPEQPEVLNRLLINAPRVEAIESLVMQMETGVTIIEGRMRQMKDIGSDPRYILTKPVMDPLKDKIIKLRSLRAELDGYQRELGTGRRELEQYAKLTANPTAGDNEPHELETTPTTESRYMRIAYEQLYNLIRDLRRNCLNLLNRIENIERLAASLEPIN